jgi:hypothetical protein
MTQTAHVLTVVERVVAFFDMCSSSQIIENLTIRDNLRVLRNALIRLKKFLQTRSGPDGFEIYKFIGDGWILLYSENTSLIRLLHSLTHISEFYQNEYLNTSFLRLRFARKLPVSSLVLIGGVWCES